MLYSLVTRPKTLISEENMRLMNNGIQRRKQQILNTVNTALLKPNIFFIHLLFADLSLLLVVAKILL